MKTRNIITAILFAAGLFVSCKKDQDNRVDEMQHNQTVMADSADTVADTTTVATNAEESDHKVTTAKADTKGHKLNSGAAKANKSKSGYSAPDGTDAENHDGDQYTRNDTLRRPTGPPIK